MASFFVNGSYDMFMPVEIKSGKGCVAANASLFALGKKCMIVTGRSSAVKSGALDDVVGALTTNGVEYTVFDKIGENPLMSVCFEGGKTAREFGADFVIGIGGGSALDASKAIAAYAPNDIEPMKIFDGGLNPSLPMILIPTTAGTGSEVNPYAVLSLDGQNKKKTFNSRSSYAKYAFVDPKYTYSLSERYTVSTALDAFAHCIESYMSPKSTLHSEYYAVSGARAILEVFSRFTVSGFFDEKDREMLMYASCAGGIAINTTGTGFPHPLGYNLTMFRGVPHGIACAYFTGKYMEYTCKSPLGAMRTDSFAKQVGYSSDAISALTQTLARKYTDKITLSEDEIELYVKTTGGASNYKNNPYVISEDEMKDIYTSLFAE